MAAAALSVRGSGACRGVIYDPVLNIYYYYLHIIDGFNYSAAAPGSLQTQVIGVYKGKDLCYELPSVTLVQTAEL